MELPVGVKSLKDLQDFYSALESQPAYRDLKKYLETRREVAIKRLKQLDDPIARATWILVDEILDRKNFIEKEAEKEADNKKANKQK